MKQRGTKAYNATLCTGALHLVSALHTLLPSPQPAGKIVSDENEKTHDGDVVQVKHDPGRVKIKEHKMISQQQVVQNVLLGEGVYQLLGLYSAQHCLHRAHREAVAAVQAVGLPDGVWRPRFDAPLGAVFQTPATADTPV